MILLSYWSQRNQISIFNMLLNLLSKIFQYCTKSNGSLNFLLIFLWNYNTMFQFYEVLFGIYMSWIRISGNENHVVSCKNIPKSYSGGATCQSEKLEDEQCMYVKAIEVEAWGNPKSDTMSGKVARGKDMVFGNTRLWRVLLVPLAKLIQNLSKYIYRSFWVYLHLK